MCLRKTLAGRWLTAGLTCSLGQTLPGEPSGCQKPVPSQVPAPFKAPAPQNLNGLLEGFCPEPRPEEQIALNSNGLMLFLRVADIEWLEAADDYVALHVGQMTHCVRETLAAVAAKLPPGRFLRVSPSTLVNIAHLKALPPSPLGECSVPDRRAAAKTHPVRSDSAGQRTATPSRPRPRLSSPGHDFRRRARRDCRNGDSRC